MSKELDRRLARLERSSHRMSDDAEPTLGVSGLIARWEREKSKNAPSVGEVGRPADSPIGRLLAEALAEVSRS